MREGDLQQLQLANACNRLVAAMDIELVVDLLEVGLDCARRHHQQSGNLRAGSASQDQVEHVTLAGAEWLVQLVGARWNRAVGRTASTPAEDRPATQHVRCPEDDALL
jgi:hypothetical protein